MSAATKAHVVRLSWSRLSPSCDGETHDSPHRRNIAEFDFVDAPHSAAGAFGQTAKDADGGSAEGAWKSAQDRRVLASVTEPASPPQTARLSAGGTLGRIKTRCGAGADAYVWGIAGLLASGVSAATHAHWFARSGRGRARSGCARPSPSVLWGHMSLSRRSREQ